MQKQIERYNFKQVCQVKLESVSFKKHFKTSLQTVRKSEMAFAVFYQTYKRLRLRLRGKLWAYSMRPPQPDY